jgi:DNA-binding NtrC family response regulator
MKEKVLIVEDQSIEALNLQRMLTKAGYEVCGIARSVDEARVILDKKHTDLVLLDIFLKGPLTGIDLAYKLREDNISFIYLSANSNQATLDAAKETCPDGFLVKPVREKDVLVMLEIARYKREHGLALITGEKAKQDIQQSEKNFGKTESITKSEGGRSTDNFHGIIGKSSKLKETLRHVEIVAPTDTSVLILGESGTGKEKIAECLHVLSKRNSGPFVKVNCAALPVNLIESILFGHERGAFTGAFERKIGKFEQAQSGTIFLDEIGELPLELQVKLLRVLQENEIERLGGKDVIKLNVRVIAATNRNLEKEISEGRFRLDLFYRLNVFPLMLPPLRERLSDIPQLAVSFAERYCKKNKKKFNGIDEQMMTALMEYNWPGNIRELENLIEQSVLLNDGISELDLNRPLHNARLISERDNNIEDAKSLTDIKKIQNDTEKKYIHYILKKTGGRIRGEGGAAQLLNLPPTTLESRMARLGIKKEDYV